MGRGHVIADDLSKTVPGGDVLPQLVTRLSLITWHDYSFRSGLCQIIKQVFGVQANKIELDHVAKAIASFEHSVVFGDSPFDRYLYGGDPSAMTDAQVPR